MNDNMEFRKAKREEAEEILQLYQSLIGTEYCVWTENYPTEREVEFDLSRNALFCLYERIPEADEGEQGARLSEGQTVGTLPVTRGRLMGVISMDDDPEVEALSCWSEDLTPVAELSRLGVAAEYQNRGIARILLQEAMAELKTQGYKAVHILVAKDNVKALRSYEKLHFSTAGDTKFKTICNAEAFILTTVVPLIIMLVINFITLMYKLSISPLKFIRKDLTRKKNRRTLKLPNFKFITRFRLRIILQNKGNYITLFVGILFANIMLLFGMMMHPLLTHYQNEIVDNMIAKNQYVLKNSVEVKNKNAEKYSLTSLQINRRSLSEDISLYGIEEDSKYFKKNIENGMYISDGLSEKYKINKGDTFTLKDKYSGKKYKIKVAEVINYPGSLSVFMTRDKLNSLIDKDKNYFSGYFSNEKLSIDDKDVASVITEKDMTKTSRQLNVSMGNMFYLINVFAICLFVLLIYLLTKLIIEKNKNSISMVKILGYNNREVGKLYITATTWMVGLSIIISLILSTEIIDQIYFEMMKDYNGWLTLYLEQKTYVEMFIIGIVCYGIVAFFQFKKIKKIPMDNALKNVE